MTIQEFYESIHGNYEEVRGRLMKDERILKYLRLFPADENCDNCFAALDAEDYDTAFRCAHNLKGMCLNLGLGDYTNAAVELCESLRNGKPAIDLAPLVEAVKQQRVFVEAQIRALVGE